MLNVVNIVARDLPDSWFQLVDAVLTRGRQWTVERGSYEGQKRWELDWAQVHITHPHVGELVPTMPSHLAHIPPPTTIEYVYQYLPYLMEDLPLKENEQYTYGSRIYDQVNRIIERYQSGYGSNQECIAVARPEDIDLPDPPCLRQIDTRIFALDGMRGGEEPELHFFPYLRSNDLWGGYPANMAAIALLQQYMADAIGVKPGQIVYTSKGCHLYDHAWGVAKLRVSYAEIGP